jgi:hypothetical protein
LTANIRDRLAVLAGDLSWNSRASGIFSMVGFSSMKYAHWTNHEIRKLRAAHVDGNPSRAELAKMFPRHTCRSIEFTAYHLRLRQPYSDFHLKWLKIAHIHFAEREKWRGSTRIYQL